MLTPAVDAYGWPFVALVLVIAALSLVAVALDFRRFARDWDRKANRAARRRVRAEQRAARAAAIRRHPAGRHRIASPGVGFHGDHRIVS